MNKAFDFFGHRLVVNETDRWGLFDEVTGVGYLHGDDGPMPFIGARIYFKGVGYFITYLMPAIGPEYIWKFIARPDLSA